MRSALLSVLLVLVNVSLAACGDDAAANSGSAAAGQVTDGYRDYCVATFTADYEVIDFFGDSELSIAAGDELLIEDFGSFSPDEVSVYYLSKAGPVPFTITAEDGSTFPFTSNCMADNLEEYVGVFANVTVYGDEALTTPACMLVAGSIEPSRGLNYELVSEIFGEGPVVYRLFGGAVGDLCGGIAEGYVKAGNAMIGSTSHTVIPLGSFSGPAGG
jgi:hypothetical protein